jgi:hypothetical protein
MCRVPDAVRHCLMPLRRAGTATNAGYRYGPGSAVHRQRDVAPRPGHDGAPNRPVSVTLIVLVRLHY